MTKKNTAAWGLPVEKRMETADGPIEYTLTRKKVRNLNLRIGPDGTIAVSAPRAMPQRSIDEFILSKSSWITRHRATLMSRPALAPCLYTKQQCLTLFTAISNDIFPLFSDLLDGQRPQIKVREMKSRWGSCNIPKRIITLNTRLAEKPRAAQEYVIMHEYVHFLHPNHQAGFHAEMARLMPDYHQRRRLLK